MFIKMQDFDFASCPKRTKQAVEINELTVIKRITTNDYRNLIWNLQDLALVGEAPRLLESCFFPLEKRWRKNGWQLFLGKGPVDSLNHWRYLAPDSCWAPFSPARAVMWRSYSFWFWHFCWDFDTFCWIKIWSSHGHCEIMIFHLQEFEPLFWCHLPLVAHKACCMNESHIKIPCLTDPNIAFVRVEVKLQCGGFIWRWINLPKNAAKHKSGILRKNCSGSPNGCFTNRPCAKWMAISFPFKVKSWRQHGVNYAWAAQYTELRF